MTVAEICGAGGCTSTNPPITIEERAKCFYDGSPCVRNAPNDAAPTDGTTHNNSFTNWPDSAGSQSNEPR